MGADALLRLKIEYRCPERPLWTAEQVALLGTVPDGELAARLGWPVHRVAYKRKSLKIAAATP